jgi:hypothetical protein
VFYHGGVRRLTVILAAFALTGAIRPAQDARQIAHAVTAYVLQYQREFVTLVADEFTTQEVIEYGAVIATRVTRGELFSTFLDTAWMSVHDISEVDGTPILNHGSVRTLLQSASLQSLAPRIAAANARFNIGHVSRNFNEPTLALLLFTPAQVDHLALDRDHIERIASGESLITLRFRARDTTSLVRSLEGQVSERGQITVEAETGRVRHTQLTISAGVVDAMLDTSYDLDPHINLWVPVTFTERYTVKKTGEVTTVRTELTNYRRFETTGRVIQ